MYCDLLEFKSIQTIKPEHGALETFEKQENDDPSTHEKIIISLKKYPVIGHLIKNKASRNPDKYAILCAFFCNLSPAKTIVTIGSTVILHAAYISAKTNAPIFAFDDFGEEIDLRLVESKKKGKQIPNKQKSINSIQNIKDLQEIDFLILGDIDQENITSSDFLREINNKLSPKSILAIHGIHKNPKMKKIWNAYESQHLVKLSLDFYEFGLLFFDSPFPKKRYTLNF